jgi:hypothetical protein
MINESWFPKLGRKQSALGGQHSAKAAMSNWQLGKPHQPQICADDRRLEQPRINANITNHSFVFIREIRG